MDLLDMNNELNLFDSSWQIRSHNKSLPPMYISKDAVLDNSIVSDGAIIKGTVRNSVISSSVEVEEGALVEDSVIMSNTYIGKNAKVIKSIIGENVVIHDGVNVYDKDGKLYSLGNNVELRGDISE